MATSDVFQGAQNLAAVSLIPAFMLRRFAHRPGLIKILDNVGWLLFDKILRMGVGLLVGIWIARYLGPERFGLLNFSIAFVAMFGAIATLGLNEIVVRDIVRNPGHAGTILCTGFVLQLLGAVTALGMVLAFYDLLRPDDALGKSMVAILGVALIFQASSIIKYWFESQVQSRYPVWVENSVFLVMSAVKVGLIIKQAPLIAFVWVVLVDAILVSIGLFVIYARQSRGLRNWTIDLSRAKQLLRASWPLVFAGIAVMTYMRIDQIMLGQLLGNEAVGIYSAAVRVSEIWYFIPMVVVASVFPSIINAKTISEDLYYHRLQRLYDLMVWLSLAIAIPMSFLSGWFISLLFGAAYEQAGAVLAIHIWASVFVFLGVASGKWFVVENRQILSMHRTVLGAIANVLLNLAFIPRFGVIGAAWATVISFSIAGLFYDLSRAETRRMYVMKVNSFNLIRIILQMARKAP